MTEPNDVRALAQEVTVLAAAVKDIATRAGWGVPMTIARNVHWRARQIADRPAEATAADDADGCLHTSDYKDPDGSRRCDWCSAVTNPAPAPEGRELDDLGRDPGCPTHFVFADDSCPACQAKRRPAPAPREDGREWWMVCDKRGNVVMFAPNETMAESERVGQDNAYRANAPHSVVHLVPATRLAEAEKASQLETDLRDMKARVGELEEDAKRWRRAPDAGAVWVMVSKEMLGYLNGEWSSPMQLRVESRHGDVLEFTVRRHYCAARAQDKDPTTTTR